jgi:hypothetical protein
MKKMNVILLFTFISLMLLNLKVSAVSGIRIGCFSSSGTLSYSSAQMDVIVHLATGVTVTGTTLMLDPVTGYWYLHSHITSGGTLGIPVTVSGGNIMMANGGCTHTCTSSGTCQCDIKNVVPCVSHDCVCSVGDGGCSSSITTNGVTITQTIIDYVTANPPANCS